MCVLVIDATEHWHPDIIAETGHLYDVYIYDADDPVYPASTTIAYECILIKTVSEKLKPRDELSAEVHDTLDAWNAFSFGEIRYFPKWRVDGSQLLTNLQPLPDGQMGHMPLGLPEAETSKDAFDDAVYAVRETI